MATLYRAETTLQDILGMRVGDELQLAGGDLPEYTEDDAGKALQVNQAGTGLEWGPSVPSYTSSDVGKVLTVGEGEPVWQTAVLAYDYASATEVDHANSLYANIGGTVMLLHDIGEQNTVVMVISDTVPTIPSMASYSVDIRAIWGVVNTVENAMTIAFDGTGVPTSGRQCYYIANSVVLHTFNIGGDVRVIVVPTDADIRAYIQ